MKKRLLTILLGLAMLLSFMPAMAFAESEGTLSASYTIASDTYRDGTSRFECVEGALGFSAIGGDILTIGSTEYTYVEDDDNDVYGFYNGDESIEERYYNWPAFFDNKGNLVDDPRTATPGEYDVKWCIVDKEDESKSSYADIGTITVTPNPIESIVYQPVKNYYTVSEIEKFKAYNDSEWTSYEIPTAAGDKLGIKMVGKDMKYYTAQLVKFDEGEEACFYDEDEEMYIFTSLYYGDNKPITGTESGIVYQFTVYHEGRECSVPITVSTLTKEEKAAKEKAAVIAAASNINKSTVTAADIKKASNLGATTVTLGPKVKKIKKNAFKGTKINTIVVKTKKLKAKSVKESLKGSKVKTVKVEIGSKKVNKKYIKSYKKFFTKKNAGKKAKVK